MISSIAKIRQVLPLIRLRPFESSTAEGRSKERYRRILLTTTTNFIVRAIASLVSLITVPVALGYLGKSEYGLWVLVTSVVGWSNLFDFGIMNSLTNALSEAHGRGDQDAARSYVSTAVVSLSTIALTVMLVTAIAAPFLPWSSLLAVRNVVPERTVMWAVLAALGCLMVGFPLSVTRQIYAAYQKSYLGNVLSLVGSGLVIAGLYAVVWTKGSLPFFVLAFSAPTVIVAVLNLIYLTQREMPWISPRLRYASRQALKKLAKVSVPLFLFQIGAMLVNETQMIVLAHVTNLQMVSEYSVFWRVGVVLISFVSLATASFVPAFREAHERGDSAWVQTGFRRMVILRMMVAAAVGLMLVFGGNFLLRVWLHRGDFQYSATLWIIQAVSLTSAVWCSSFTDLLTIMDQVWILVLLVMINGIATVTLTVFLAPHYGLVGTVISLSFVSVCLWTWIVPLLTNRILRRSKTNVVAA